MSAKKQQVRTIYGIKFLSLKEEGRMPYWVSENGKFHIRKTSLGGLEPWEVYGDAEMNEHYGNADSLDEAVRRVICRDFLGQDASKLMGRDNLATHQCGQDMKITGKPDHISREEVRAILEATFSVLRFHKVATANKVKHVQFVTAIAGKTKVGTDIAGDWTSSLGRIRALRCLKYSAMVTVLIHETLHAYFNFGSGDEKVISTLTARLKPDIVKLANDLVQNTYKRAGYIAHTKISYKPVGADRYDGEQYHENHEPSFGDKFRKKRGAI